MIVNINEFYRRKKGDFMSKPLEKLCGKSADYILETYGHKYRYPIDIVGIVENIGGISLGSMDFEELDKIFFSNGKEGHIIGAVRVKDDGVQIIYSKKLDEDKNEEFASLSESEKKEKLIRRQRFTIAHELGHCCLHIAANRKESYIDFRSKDTEREYSNDEKVANVFAGELLMPKHIIEAFIEDPKKYDVANDKGEISIRKMADAFWVNNHVMYERLMHLKSTDELKGCAKFDVSEVTGVKELWL